jgi:hypothetical protein
MTPKGRIRELASTLEGHFDNVTGHPVEQVGGYPHVVIYPGSPFVAPGDFCDREIHLQIIVYLSRANDREGMDHALDTIHGVASAVNEAGGAWQEMDLMPIELGGTSHLAAVHDTVLYQ